MVGQLKIQMGRKFVQRYSRKYFRHRTGNSSYCWVGEISSLLGKIDIYFRSCGIISIFHGKNFLQLRIFVKFSHLFDIFPNFGNKSENSVNYQRIYEIFPLSVGKSMFPKELGKNS